MFAPYMNILGSNFKKTFESMSGLEISLIEIIRDEEKSKQFSIVSTIPYKDLYNKVTGQFNLGLTSDATAIQVASAIGSQMGVSPITTFDDQAQDILNEFMNILVGHTITEWDSKGLSVEFGTPTLTKNKNLDMSNIPSTDTYQIIFKIEGNSGKEEIVCKKITLCVTFSNSEQKRKSHQKILVVEDSNMMRRVVSKALVDSGYEVMEAIDGLDAIEKYSSFCPDLTLMDINMPKMSGLDAIEKIKQTSPTASFIMLTSSSRRDEVVAAKALNVSGYLIKPISPAQLVERVHRVLQ